MSFRPAGAGEARRPGTFTRLLYHVAFSTKHRADLIATELQPRLYEHVAVRDRAAIYPSSGGASWSTRIRGGAEGVAGRTRDRARRAIPGGLSASSAAPAGRRACGGGPCPRVPLRSTRGYAPTLLRSETLVPGPLARMTTRRRFCHGPAHGEVVGRNRRRLLACCSFTIVPEGHLTVAQHAVLGLDRVTARQVPYGTTESSAVPMGLGFYVAATAPALRAGLRSLRRCGTARLRPVDCLTPLDPVQRQRMTAWPAAHPCASGRRLLTRLQCHIVLLVQVPL